MRNITIGESCIEPILLVDVDGNNINRDDAEGISVQIRQYNRVLATYIYPDDEVLTDGTAANELNIEITQVLSAKLREGKVYARAVINNDDSEFEEDLEQLSLPDYHILTAYSSQPPDEEDVVDTIEHYRGFYDASVNAAPSSGGAGTAGAILAGDYWISNVAGTVFGIYCPTGTRFTALVNSPGQTSGNWQLSGSLG